MGNWLQDFWNGLTGQTSEDKRTKETNDANLKSVLDTNQANRDIARETNETNKSIAMENLVFQRDVQEYNKALQQQLFEREDTSYQRTAEDMLKAGLNPLTMQNTNDAGQPIAMSPLNNNYQAQIGAPMQAAQFIKSETMNQPIQALNSFVGMVGSVISSIESLKTGSVTRDSLRSQIDVNRLNSFFQNADKGLSFDTNGNPVIDNGLMKKYLETKAKEKDYDIAKMENDIREWNHMKSAGKYYSDNKYEQIITALEDWLVNGRGADAWNKLVEKYPILKIFSNQAYDYSIKKYPDMSEEEKKEWSKNVNTAVQKAEESNPVLKSSSKSKSQYR